MRILDEPKNVAERIEDRCDPNALAYFLHGRAFLRADGNQPLEFRRRLRNSPKRDDASTSAGRAGRVRVETEFVAGDVEADVKRLVEVWLDPQRFRIPRFGLRQIRRVINDGAEALKSCFRHYAFFFISARSFNTCSLCSAGFTEV